MSNTIRSAVSKNEHLNEANLSDLPDLTSTQDFSFPPSNSTKTIDQPASCSLPCTESIPSTPSPYPTAVNRFDQFYNHPLVWFDRENEKRIDKRRFLFACMQDIGDLLVSIS